MKDFAVKLNILFFLIFSSFICSGKQEIDNTKSNTSSSGNDNTKETNSIKKTTSKDDIIIKTSDSKELSASYYYNSETIETSQPLVILIHQFNQTKEQWKSDFTDSLVNSGIKVLTYDIRGHGKSSKVSYELSRLLDDPDEAPNDIKACFEWAKNQKGIDFTRIGVMGTSIGGNLACYAAINLNAKAIVSVSNSKSTFEIYAGYDEKSMRPPKINKFKNSLFICGSKDGDHEQEQKWIMENFADDPKELKVYDSEKHGMFLIEQFPEINTLSINWFKKYL